MRELNTKESLEEIVGTRPLAVMMKTIDELDDGCRTVLANSPIAGFGYRDNRGRSHTTVIGGARGFVRVETPRRISFDMGGGPDEPAPGFGVSMTFLIPGVGETLRLTGSLADRSEGSVAIDVAEAWVHCAKCILRSGLWDEARRTSAESFPGVVSLLGDDELSAFLASSPFVFISSWDAAGASDTSPKGDLPGFVQVIDRATLAIPDRKGNRRTDTFHNLLECDELSLAALSPGRNDLLHLRGRAFVTDDAELRTAMAIGDRPPSAALVVQVRDAEISPNQALERSSLWDRSALVDPATVPDLMVIGARHIAANKATGTKATMTRALTRGLGAAPALLRKGIDWGYRKELDEEGY